MSKLTESLAKLDPSNDEHWTTDGMPRLDALEKIHGASVARADITAAAPKFNRKNPEIAAPAQPAQATQAATPATPAPTPAATPQPEQQSAQEADDGDEGTDAFKAAEAELAEANAEYQAARKRVNAANDVMDDLIRKREAESAGRTSMADIKAFQRSQSAQRAAALQHASEVQEVLREKNLL